MRCRKIQELLKSDYLDGQTNERQGRFIKEHLLHCAQCSKLEEGLQAQRALLQSAQRLPVPEGIWQDIRQNILNEELKEAPGVWERLRDYIFAPRPVFVLASAFTIVIFVTVFFAIQKGQFFGKPDDAADDMVMYSLNGEANSSLYGLGTDIEEYFL